MSTTESEEAAGTTRTRPSLVPPPPWATVNGSSVWQAAVGGLRRQRSSSALTSPAFSGVPWRSRRHTSTRSELSLQSNDAVLSTNETRRLAGRSDSAEPDQYLGVTPDGGGPHRARLSLDVDGEDFDSSWSRTRSGSGEDLLLPTANDAVDVLKRTPVFCTLSSEALTECALIGRMQEVRPERWWWWSVLFSPGLFLVCQICTDIPAADC